MECMTGYIGPGNIAVDPRLVGLDLLREVEVSKKQMSDTTIHEIVPVFSTHSAF